MSDLIVSRAYARSIFELGEEAKVDVAGELTTVTELINQSNDLENVLFLDVFLADEKQDVLTTLFSKMTVSKLIQNFIFFLLDEGRLSILPTVFKEVVILDDDKKGFLRGVIEGSESAISPEMEASIKKYLVKKIGKDIILDYQQNGDITAGTRVTVADLQLDATIDNQLDTFKRSILGEN